MSETTPLAALRELAPAAWLVGGAVRDELLGRATDDLDVITEGDVRELARALGRRLGAHSFALSEAFGAWRVSARDRCWQIDLTGLAGASLQDDLARRDLTINAMARRLGDGQLFDPFDGQEDLKAGRLRMVRPSAFREDPLRVLRLSRLAAQLDYEIDPATASEASAGAPGLSRVAGERIFAELRQIIASERPVDGLSHMDSTGATAVVLPELLAVRGLEQSAYHHLDVHDHTLAVLERTLDVTAEPGRLFPEVAQPLEQLLAEPLADDLTRAQALRFGALFHDLAKSRTRGVTQEGRVTFIGHDVAGADLAVEVLSRLRASERLASHVAALTRHHLRLGFLVHQMPLTGRDVFRYLKACEPVEVDVTLLSVADRLATLGRKAEAAVERHLELARQILPQALAWHAARPRPPLRGDRLAELVGIQPGPELGRLLDELTEAAFAGEVQGEEEAVEWARSAQRIARLRDR